MHLKLYCGNCHNGMVHGWTRNRMCWVSGAITNLVSWNSTNGIMYMKINRYINFQKLCIIKLYVCRMWINPIVNIPWPCTLSMYLWIKADHTGILKILFYCYNTNNVYYQIDYSCIINLACSICDLMYQLGVQLLMGVIPTTADPTLALRAI